MDTTELEVRFLEINRTELIKKLRELGAQDLGESLLEEIIFYDQAKNWQQQQKLVRLRKNGDITTLAYKHHRKQAVDGATEIEFTVSDSEKASDFLRQLGLEASRHQQKRRHTFRLGEIVVDIDTWPRIPTYVELEGPDEARLRHTAAQLGLDWSKVVYANALTVIESYGVPVGSLRWFTFDKVG